MALPRHWSVSVPLRDQTALNPSTLRSCKLPFTTHIGRLYGDSATVLRLELLLKSARQQQQHFKTPFAAICWAKCAHCDVTVHILRTYVEARRRTSSSSSPSPPHGAQPATQIGYRWQAVNNTSRSTVSCFRRPIDGRWRRTRALCGGSM
jgi:hypothetical protein